MTIYELRKKPDALAKIRRDMIIKGYCTKGDISRFIPCNTKRAAQIYNEIEDAIHKKGKRMMAGKIPVTWILEYMGWTRESVLEAYRETLK